MKKNIRQTGWALLLYDTAFFLGSIIFSMGVLIQNPALSNEAYTKLITESGLPSLTGIAFGFLILLLLRRKKLFTQDFGGENKKMTSNTFLKLLCCFMAVQLVFSLVSSLAEALFNLFGYTLMEQINAATATSSTISMFIYGSFAAPFIEELVFRGVVLRSLEPYGKAFAIITSAILFGVYHGNLTQGIFAAAIGLVLGYVALEYSIKWAMLLHLVNNMIFGDALSFLTQHLSKNLQMLIPDVIMFVFFIFGAKILFDYRKEIKRYVQNHPTANQAYRYTFLSISILLFILLNLFMAVSSIQPL